MQSRSIEHLLGRLFFFSPTSLRQSIGVRFQAEPPLRVRKRWIFPEPIESVSVKHHDGTIDSFQRARVGSELDSTQLERLYWDEIRRVTLRGEVSRGAIRVGGFWPVILRFGPLVDGRRPITGGLFARGAGGTIGWQADGEHTAVIVQGFTPLLGGPFWRLEHGSTIWSGDVFLLAWRGRNR